MPVTARFPLFSVEIERDLIPVDTLRPVMVPDPSWRHVDRQGHGHFWDGDDLPTVEWVVTGRRWVGDEYDGAEVDEGEYRCRQCADVVVPGLRAAKQDPVYGPTTIAVTFMPEAERFVLDEDEYAGTVERWREDCRRAARRVERALVLDPDLIR